MSEKKCLLKLRSVLTYLVGILAAFGLSVGLFAAAIEFTAFDADFYAARYEELGVAEDIGFEPEELNRVTRELIDYCCGAREDLIIDGVVNGEERQIFVGQELEHMVDVQKLFLLMMRFVRVGIPVSAVLLCVAALLAQKGKRLKTFARSCLWGLAIFGAVFVAILVWVGVDFNSFWIAFHRIFFTNDLWMFDPDESIMINMFPEQFFYKVMVRVLITLGVLLLVQAAAGVAASIINKRKADKK